MQPDKPEKNLELERLVFFSDAVVAIAITLLALDLKVVPAGPHITFADIGRAWHKYAAFLLSFVIIAVFWVNHHRFFVYIKAIDSGMMLYNMYWLLFLVLLPFTSTLISSDFFDMSAMLVYSLNVFAVTCFQTLIWYHVTHHKELLKDTITETVIKEYRAGCNLAMFNSILAIGITFFSPLIALITLFTRLFFFRRGAQKYLARLTARQNAMDRTKGE